MLDFCLKSFTVVEDVITPISDKRFSKNVNGRVTFWIRGITTKVLNAMDQRGGSALYDAGSTYTSSSTTSLLEGKIDGWVFYKKAKLTLLGQLRIYWLGLFNQDSSVAKRKSAYLEAVDPSLSARCKAVDIAMCYQNLAMSLLARATSRWVCKSKGVPTESGSLIKQYFLHF